MAEPVAKRVLRAAERAFVFSILSQLNAHKSRLGLSSREIAIKLEVSPRRVRRLLAGKAKMTLRDLGEILWAMGLDAEIKVIPRQSPSPTTKDER